MYICMYIDKYDICTCSSAASTQMIKMYVHDVHRHTELQHQLPGLLHKEAWPKLHVQPSFSVGRGLSMNGVLLFCVQGARVQHHDVRHSRNVEPSRKRRSPRKACYVIIAT